MTRKAPVNVAASVRARLLTVSKERQEDFTLTLMNYGAERFLYRLAQCKYFCRRRSSMPAPASPSRRNGGRAVHGRSVHSVWVTLRQLQDTRERAGRVKAAKR